MFREQLKDCLAGGLIALAGLGSLPDTQALADSPDVRSSANQLNAANLPDRAIFGQPAGRLSGYKLPETASEIPESRIGNSLPYFFGAAGAVAGLAAAEALRKQNRNVSDDLTTRHILFGIIGAAVAFTAGAQFATYKTVDSVTEVARVVSTSEPFYKRQGTKIQTTHGPYYRQEFFIPEISTLPLTCEVKDRPLVKGDVLDMTFYINSNNEIVAWGGVQR